MPKQTYDAIQKEVHHKLGAGLDSLIKYIEFKSPELWGEEKPRLFTRKSVIMWLYKEMKSTGYTKTLTEVDLTEKVWNHNSFRHNSKILRRLASD
jgi:hypothetical protein